MLGQISLCHAKIEKIPEKIFLMINKDGGGEFLHFMGDIELMEVPPVPSLGKTLVSDIHLKIASNGHAHKLYQPRWIKELQTR